MKTRGCQKCNGYGVYYQGYGIGTQRCDQCEGSGRIPWPDEWRPYEQVKPNCGRCGRIQSKSMGCPFTCKDYNGSHLC